MANHYTGSLRVAVLRNFSLDLRWGHLNFKSLTERIRKFQPDSTIDVFAPIAGDLFPDPAHYNLIILTGGPTSLLQDTLPEWAQNTLEYVRATVRDSPSTKLLGICWGHLAIAKALGGELGQVEPGQGVGVKSYALTDKGEEFFVGGTGTAKESLSISKFHRRIVTRLPPGFDLLCENNEVVISHSGKVMGIQGHPEMDKETAQAVLEDDDGSYTNARTPEESIEVERQFATDDHDGILIFGKIVDWVMESKTAQA